jgi:hypothetical protein
MEWIERAEVKITMNAVSATHSRERLLLRITRGRATLNILSLFNATRPEHDQTAIPRSSQIPEKKTFAMKLTSIKCI